MKFDTEEDYIAWFRANATVPVVLNNTHKPLEEVVTDEQLTFFNKLGNTFLDKRNVCLVKRDNPHFVKTIDTLPVDGLVTTYIPPNMTIRTEQYPSGYLLDVIVFKDVNRG
jgi:DNA-directed RNA polymerase subunit L